MDKISYQFTNCGKLGNKGPSQTDADNSYRGTTLEGKVKVSTGAQKWKVPVSGLYRIEAYGAQGGRHGWGQRAGGYGAKIQGEFTLNAGEEISVIVGQMGGDSKSSGDTDNAGPGGGGGSFVFRNVMDRYPLIAAGGGGGASRNGSMDANSTENGKSGEGKSNGGSGGNGGRENTGGSSYWSGGGAGWLTNGTGGNMSTNYDANKGSNNQGEGGICPRYGGNGGSRGNDGNYEGGDGGFGGGGGGTDDNGGTGGGGGYSGGGGACSSPTNGRGGGGGSYNSGANQVNTAMGRAGHGLVIITEISTNEPPTSPSFIKQPILNSISLSGESVLLEWNPSTDKESDAISYEVEFFDGSSWRVLVSDINVNSYSAIIPTTVTNKAQFRIRAGDIEGGKSEYTIGNVFSITTKLALIQDDGVVLAYKDGVWKAIQ
ncbi:glycine rich domain-containing protein [Bacillus thuringiensis]|uniref:glycine rich domain-containing protein n=1 Tax=Bacillus thuringiensis TaxID=1428 RepID=UPI00366D301E